MTKHWNRALAALAGMAMAVGCDDGPTQTFAPLPAGAVAPNKADAGAYVDIIPQQKLGASTAGSNALVLCTPEKLRKTWEGALQQPIVPIRGMAGIDATANLTFLGVTIDQVEQQLCQGNDLGTGATSFGEQGEVIFTWSASTRFVTNVYAFAGYRGVLQFTDPKTMSQFTVSLESKPIDVAGQPMRWNWRDAKSRAQNATLFYNAIMMALAPDKLPKDPSGNPIPDTNCTASGGCIATILANTIGAFAIVPLGFLQVYFDLGVDDAVGKDIVTRVYVPVQKDFPYTALPFTAKLPGPVDMEGPVSKGALGPNQSQCVVKPGIKYSNFVSTCIDVTGDATKDAAEEKKFIAGVTHNDEEYVVDVIGIDPQFLSTRIHNSIEPATILDTDRPEAGDPLQRLTIDQQVKGRLLNDYVAESPTGKRDNHGSGLVNLTYAILVQQALDAADTTNRPKHPIGDPACQLNPDGTPATPPPTPPPPPMNDGSTDGGPGEAGPPPLSAVGCTGMEGLVTTAQKSAVPAGPLQNVALGASSIVYTTSTGLKPANNQIASFMDDPTAGLASVNNDVQVVTWAGSARRVIKVLGQGDRLRVPPAFREPRAYSTIWMQALTQYLIARGNVGPALTLQDVLDAGPNGAAAHHIDPNYFFFDTEPNLRQQFDTAEYVDRDFATMDNPWIDLRIVVDSTGGILNQFTFDTYPQKGEIALLSAVGDPQKPIGSDGTMLLMNIFGSATLSSNWSTDPADPASPYKTAYECASADLDPTNAAQMATFIKYCGAANLPPVDATGNFAKNLAGRPLLEPYKGGFTSTASILNIGRNIGLVPSDVFKPLVRNVSIEQAKVQFATMAAPFNPLGTPGAPVVRSVGYVQPTENTGFFIAINASRDRFVKAEDFFTTGDALTTTLEAVPVLQDLAVVPGVARIGSVNTNDFLGEAFVCMDSGELLTVRMFTPAEVVLDYLLRHPGAYAGCNLIVDYFEYGTVLSRVTSITNGVIVNFTRPSGITANANNSAVSDVDLFAPGQ
jgi:hypothetical protein